MAGCWKAQGLAIPFPGIGGEHRVTTWGGLKRQAIRPTPFPATLVLVPMFQFSRRSKTHSGDKLWARQHSFELWAQVGVGDLGLEASEVTPGADPAGRG